MAVDISLLRSELGPESVYGAVASNKKQAASVASSCISHDDLARFVTVT